MNIEKGITEAATKKVTVTISRKELWFNFVDMWSSLAWDNYCGTGPFTEVANVLLSGENLSVIYAKVEALFRKGSWTCAMLGDYMAALNKPGILREIVIFDEDQGTGEPNDYIRIFHEDINF